MTPLNQFCTSVFFTRIYDSSVTSNNKKDTKDEKFLKKEEN
jgi:hypothetical protein